MNQLSKDHATLVKIIDLSSMRLKSSKKKLTKIENKYLT